MQVEWRTLPDCRLQEMVVVCRRSRNELYYSIEHISWFMLYQCVHAYKSCLPHPAEVLGRTFSPTSTAAYSTIVGAPCSFFFPAPACFLPPLNHHFFTTAHSLAINPWRFLIRWALIYIPLSRLCVRRGYYCLLFPRARFNIFSTIRVYGKLW